MAKIAFAVLMERAIQEYAANSLMSVAFRAGQLGYTRISTTYGRTDIARNALVARFLEWSTDDKDTLIMLDCDHKHPVDILERLVAHDVGVVGALAFRRGEPYDPCVFLRDDEGVLCRPGEWDPDLIEAAIVGTGAIAIQRWVFGKLEQAGSHFPFFRYEYVDGQPEFPTEDIYFGLICEKAGIPHYCDMSLVTPHLTVSTVDDQSWKQWKADHEADMVYGKVQA